MPRILDVEQALLLLELEPPFDQRTVQLARRRMAKRWHPGIAPPGRQHEHQRHLQAINEAADQLEQLAETSRGGRVTRNAVKVSAAATRKAREEAGRRAYEAEQRARSAAAERAKHDPFGSRVPDHSVVHRYARCTSYPEWGVGTVTGIYFSGDDEDVQQWARVRFAVGVRTPSPRATPNWPRSGSSTRVTPSRTIRWCSGCSPPPSGRPGTFRPPRARCAIGRERRPIGPPPSGSRPASTRTWARSTSLRRRPNAPPNAPPTTRRPGSGGAACACA